ncbi:MAG: glycosyltransferase family 9 protein [Candidatus Omnitrophica bacterium]|nr:glycosyltransferase family 9 protein [Candidatus Omnitrophota bacterium]
MATPERISILLVTLSNIGDVILTTPVIASLRSIFPWARLTVVAGPRAAPLLEKSRLIDRLLVYDKQAGLAHKLRLVRVLREEFYEWAVDLRNSALPFFVRAERRSPIFRHYRSKRARDRHLEILPMMNLKPGGSVKFDFFSKEEEAALSEKLKAKGFLPSVPCVVVAPGAGSEAKRWPVENFAEVVKGLAETSSFNFAAVGDSREAPLAEKISGVDPRRVVSLAGELTLRELAALVSEAALVLSNDSACMHLGYELCRPVVAVFGPTEPEKYGRENEIWRIVRNPDSDSLRDLAPEKVYAVCRELLDESSID